MFLTDLYRNVSYFCTLCICLCRDIHYEYAHTHTSSILSAQANLVTVTSHIAYHIQVSRAFTCSSVQQGLYAAASTGKRGSKCIQRAPAETTEARVLLLLLLCSWPGGGEHRGCWWRRVSGFKRIFFLFFYPTGSGQIQTQHRSMCVRVCVGTMCLL